MFDLQGNVIGINTAIFSPTGGNVGIGFAIPAEQAQAGDRGPARAGGKIKRGYLGVGIQPLSRRISPTASACPRTRGEIVARVEPGEARLACRHPARAT